jgi:hypothetical protein
MHAVLTGWLCLALAAGPTTPSASLLAPSKPAKPEPNGKTPLAAAEQAWRDGDFATVRALLEPIAADSAAVLEPADRETMLVLLADAWLGDKSLDLTERTEQATTYLNRLMDGSPDWEMRKGAYSPELYDLYGDLRFKRAGRAGEECQASLVVCKSDHAGTKDEVARQKDRYIALEKRYQAQEVEVRETVARSRVLAAIPFGFGHFYNGEPAFGGSFLAAEVILGAAGLGLLIQRTVVDGCRRTRGFQSGSLVCNPRGEDDPAADAERRNDIVRRRKGEEVVGWMLLGVVALDIVIAQIRFKPSRTKSIDRRPRSELDAARDDPAPGAGGRRKATPKKPRASLRAAPRVAPRGAGVGVHVRF